MHLSLPYIIDLLILYHIRARKYENKNHEIVIQTYPADPKCIITLFVADRNLQIEQGYFISFFHIHHLVWPPLLCPQQGVLHGPRAAFVMASRAPLLKSTRFGSGHLEDMTCNYVLDWSFCCRMYTMLWTLLLKGGLAFIHYFVRKPIYKS